MAYPVGRTLRPYQLEAVDAVETAWAQGTSRPAVVLPTGSGKSTVIAALATRARARGQRVVMLAHRGELLGQMADSVHQVDPAGQRVGIVQASRRQTGAEIVSASFQSLGTVRRVADLGRRDIVLCDEAHHAPAKSFTTVMDRLGSFDTDSGVMTAGFTATMSRGKAGGLGAVWDEVVFERDIMWGIESGFLIRPFGLTVQLPDLNLSKVKVTRGDYSASQLEAAMAASVDSTVAAARQHIVGRASIVFAAGVEHAENLAAGLNDAGIKSECVTGTMPRAAREAVYDRFRDGQLDAMVTVSVLTEGADFPRCDAVLMARPTKSRTLYIQMVGRALRPYPGKRDALVVDLTGAARGHSLTTLSDLVTEAPTKTVDLAGDEVDEPNDEPADEPAPKRERMGVLVLEELDLLRGGRTPVTWLRTRGGVWFFQTAGHIVFLWPENGGVKIGYMNDRGEKKGGWLAGGYVGPVDHAMEAAETLTESELGFPLPRADSPWRDKSEPSTAQMRMAKTYGITNAENMTRARLSDEISIAVVSRRLGK